MVSGVDEDAFVEHRGVGGIIEVVVGATGPSEFSWEHARAAVRAGQLGERVGKGSPTPVWRPRVLCPGEAMSDVVGGSIG
jgi:hypothetical protein